MENIPWEIISSHTDGAKKKAYINNSCLVWWSIFYYFAPSQSKEIALFQNIIQSSWIINLNSETSATRKIDLDVYDSESDSDVYFVL